MRLLNIIKQLILFKMRCYFKLLSKIKVTENEVPQLDPPYIILGNHSNYWDPFMISAFLKRHVYFVASIEYFKKLSTRYFLKIAGAIPKTKFMRDSSTIKRIINLKKQDKIIGLFPEGMRCWDGQTQEIIFSTAKLLKLLKIPVVMATIKGAHLTKPRWASHRRRGTIEISFQQILDKQQLKNMDVDMIYQSINEQFKYDEYQYQAQVMNSYPGKNLAERLELFIFTCPHCQSLDTMVSRGDQFFCQQCSYTTNFNQYSWLESAENDLYFDNPRDWNDWQLQYLEKYIEGKINDLEKHGRSENAIIKENGVELFIDNSGKWQPILSGNLSIQESTLIFTQGDAEAQEFILGEIRGLNIHSACYVEFYYQNTRHRFKFINANISAYKWLKIIEITAAKNEITPEYLQG